MTSLRTAVTVDACLSFCLVLTLFPFGSEAVTLDYTVYKAKGFAAVVNGSLFNVFFAWTDLTCVFKCNYASATNSCVAAQYDSATRTCIIMTSWCNQMALVDNATSNVYTQSSFDNQLLPIADFFYPMSYACYLSLSNNFGSASGVSFTAVGNSTSYSAGSGFLSNTAWLGNDPPVFPALNYFLLQSSSPSYALNIFGGSFTVSFIAATAQLGGAWIPNQPVIEALGSATGQICYAWRFSDYCRGMRFTYNTNCNSSLFNHIIARYFTANGLTHFATVYDSVAKTMTLYLNGTYWSTVSYTHTPPITPITRLNIGGSDVNAWTTWSNGLYGSISCILLSGRALVAIEISTLYNYCSNTKPGVFV